MAHEGPEHRIVQMVLQGPEYHYILDVPDNCNDSHWNNNNDSHDDQDNGGNYNDSDNEKPDNSIVEEEKNVIELLLFLPR